MSRASRTITVLVGTDCHPFKRIIDWADKWAQSNPSDRVIVQHGHSAPPRIAAGRDFVSPKELATLLEASDIVILHGGPATISEARKAGHLPLVFPRDPQYGEHVDDHQQRFTRWSAKRGLALCVESAQELDAHVAASAENEAGTRLLIEAETFGADEAAQKLAALLHKRRTSTNRASVGAPLVLYIAAPSGSAKTLLASVRSRTSVAVLGNTSRLWQRGVVDNENCSCNVPFHECEFWRAVGKSAFGGWDEVDVRGLTVRADAAGPRVFMPGSAARTRDARQQLAWYSGYYQAVYAAARDVSGADVLVDSGQDPMLASALSCNREIDLRFLEVAAAPAFWPTVWNAAAEAGPSRLSAIRAARAMVRHHIPRVSLPPSAVGDKQVVAWAWSELGLPGDGLGDGVEDGLTALTGLPGLAGLADRASRAMSTGTGTDHAMAVPRSATAPRAGRGSGTVARTGTGAASGRPARSGSGAGFGTGAGKVRIGW